MLLSTCLRKVVDNLASMAPNSGRNDALNRAAWTLGRWIAAGALEQADVEDELCPVSLAESGGYDGAELRQLLEIVTEHREMIERAWHDHFGR